MLEILLLVLFIMIITVVIYTSIQVNNLERWYQEREHMIKTELKELDISIECYVNSEKKITSKLVFKYFGRHNNFYGNHYTKPMEIYEVAAVLKDMERINYLDVLMPKLVTKDPVPEITFKVKK